MRAVGHDALLHLLKKRSKKRRHLLSLLYTGFALIHFQDLTLFHQAQPLLLQFYIFKVYINHPHVHIDTALSNLRFHVSTALRELCVHNGLQFTLLETSLFQSYATFIPFFRRLPMSE